MKKVLLLAMTLIGMVTVAQEKEKSERNKLSAEQHATLQTKRMTLALDLSAAQQTQIMSLNVAQAESRKAKMEERKARKDSDESKKPTDEERYAMRIAKLDQRIAHKAEMKKILSAEQYEKWEKMAKRKGKGKGKHKKGKGKKDGDRKDRDKR